MKIRISEHSDFMEAFVKMLEGRQAKASLDLDGVQFHIGKSKVKVDGNVVVTFVPIEKKK